MTTFIALIDGSQYSGSVCDHAAWAASRAGAQVRLMHVLGRREVASEPVNLGGSIGLGARTALLEELSELDAQKARLAQKRGRMILDDAEGRLKAGGVEHVSETLRIGDFVETLQEVEQTADMLIFGKRGEAADFAKLHLGSNLERAVRAVHKPVLVASRAFKPIQRVLVAFDGGASARQAVSFLAASALFEGLDIRLLMAGLPAEQSHDALDAAVDQLRKAGRAVTADCLPGQADEVIVRAVEDDSADLLVMGAYGHSRMRSLIIGSTTTEMVRSCRIPVMLFR